MRAYPNIIGGRYSPINETMDNINPSDINDIIGKYAVASTRDIEEAIIAAEESFNIWSHTNALVRFETLDQIGNEIISRSAEIGDMLSREEGKTLKEAVAEVRRAGQIFKYYAAEAYRANGEELPSVRDGIDLKISREPIGVVGIITPWNFPIAIPAWKIAPALAYGNTVVFKPAELVPGSAWLLSDIINKSTLPKGAFNLVMGHGPSAGDTIVSSPRVAGVTFTGSTGVGKIIGKKLFDRSARMQLEMGGKNPLIVLDDAPLELAIDCAIQGAFFSTGQRCTASSRLIVTPSIYSSFVNGLVQKMKKLVIGDAREALTDIGPVVSAAQLSVDKRYIEIGLKEGASLAVGGTPISSKTPGYYLSPALFIDTDNKMQINRDEIFGPIAAVIPAKNYDEALVLANDTDAGLSSGIVTQDPKVIRHFRANAEAGMVQINLPTAGMDFHAPFTGRKHAAYGPPEKGIYAREFFTYVKVTHEKRVFE